MALSRFTCVTGEMIELLLSGVSVIGTRCGKRIHRVGNPGKIQPMRGANRPAGIARARL